MRDSQTRAKRNGKNSASLPKCPTGIEGLDAVTLGGLPRGRPTLIAGSAGCGKTLFGLEFLVRGIRQFNEPGVFMTFEERTEDLVQNVAALGFDLNALVAENKLAIDHVEIERSQIEETGEYDLEGLFVRLNYAIDSIGAKRVVLDTIESLFAGLSNQSILRAELRRLFMWLKEKGATAIITGERGEGALTRHGLEEYVSDCVIFLDHRVADSVFTRRLRIVKYRGSTHGTNEYPFLIDNTGISVLPVTTVELNHKVSNERISSGIPALDEMLGGRGFYRGSTILVSGTAGTGKTSIASHFANETCSRGERCLYFGFEESQDQLVRNMRSIGLNLDRWIKQGLLRYSGSRPTMFGLEMHLVRAHKLIAEFQPAVVIMDPISSLLAAGARQEATNTMLRVVDILKGDQITGLFTNLVSGGSDQESTDLQMSSLIDSWLLLRDIEIGGERNRGLYVLKSRGMAHSNQIREFLLTNNGVELRAVYLGPGGVLTGSARLAMEAKERAEEAERLEDLESRRLEYEHRAKSIEAQIAALTADLESERRQFECLSRAEKARETASADSRADMARSRRAAAAGATRKNVGAGGS